MSAIPGIDYRHCGIHGSAKGAPSLGCPHCNDICMAAYHPGSIGYRFSFLALDCSAPAKPRDFRQGLTWQIQRKDGFCTWFVKKRQFFSHLPHGCTLLDFLQCGQPDPELCSFFKRVKSSGSIKCLITRLLLLKTDPV